MSTSFSTITICNICDKSFYVDCGQGISMEVDGRSCAICAACLKKLPANSIADTIRRIEIEAKSTPYELTD